MVRHKSSKLKKHNDGKIKEFAGQTTAAETRGVRIIAYTAAIASWSTVLHGNNAVNLGAVLTTWSEEESLLSIVVVRHSFGKKSRQ